MFIIPSIRGFVDKNEDVSDMVKKVDYGTKVRCRRLEVTGASL